MQQSQEREKTFDFGFGIMTNPPFQDEAKTNEQEQKKEQFYHLINFDTNIQKCKGLLLIQGYFLEMWVYINSDRPIVIPYFSGICRRSIPGHKEKYSYLITGGVVYDGSPENIDSMLSIPETTNYCFRIECSPYLASFRLQMEHITKGKTRVEIDAQGKKIEVSDLINLISPMNDPRHNHQLFEIEVEKDKYDFIAVGGQYTSLTEGVSSILQNCERFYQQKNTWKPIASMNFSRAGFSGFVQNNKIYVFGGLHFDTERNATSFLNPSQSEVYDFKLDKWTQLKFKWKMGMSSQLLGALCVPVPQNQNKILIIGGSNGNTGPTTQISMMDLDKLQVDYLPSKVALSTPRAKATGKILINRKFKRVIKTNCIYFQQLLDKRRGINSGRVGRFISCIRRGFRRIKLRYLQNQKL